MSKVLFGLFFIILSLYARENPFFPAKDEEDIPYTTNKEIHYTPLKRAAISLPSTARTIESITIRYKNLDGSITSKSEDLGNSIDWHLPIFISQNINMQHSQTLKPKKIDTKQLFSMKFLKITTRGKSIYLHTKDKMLRNFMLTDPQRIVCDIKRDIDIRSVTKKINKSIVKKIRIGNHKGYYRIVMELDGYYKYRVSNKSDSCIFRLE